ncbi:hypothetical protein [Alloactinosynnema sp. L-07]|uniref:hypothetical protein n=1 Tax=Alloactinosynnema sp. L-07 TaxID=1653480 RepID=UPI0012F87A66|nr:hypothetical protein [Alloactinosynnema sp. L-07]
MSTESESTELAITSSAEWPAARRSLSRWLLRRDVPELLACDVVLVAEEALTLDGPLSITAEASAEAVVLTITGQAEIDPVGLPMAHAAAEKVEVERTTVVAHFPLPRSEAP